MHRFTPPPPPWQLVRESTLAKVNEVSLKEEKNVMDPGVSLIEEEKNVKTPEAIVLGGKLEEDTIIMNLEDEDEQGWCKGRKENRVGLYPANYVEPLT